MLNDLLFIYQQEHYDAKRFLRFAYTNWKWWSLQKRQKLDWTTKVKLVTLLYVLTTICLFLSALQLHNIWLIVIMIGWYIVTPIVLVTIVKLLGPVEGYLKSLRYARARKVLEKHRPIVIGITGSYGKTSMKEILRTVLEQSGKKIVATPGNINTTMGVAQFIIDQQTVLEKTDYLIIEMGAYHIGNIRETARLVEPDYSFVTAVGPVHLERFGSIEKIKQAKMELPQETKQKVYVNGDGGRTREAIEQYKIEHAVFCSKDDVTNIRSLENFSGLEFTYNNLTYQTAMLAQHNIVLLEMAIAFAQDQGIDPGDITYAVSQTKPFSHRLEPIHNKQTNVWVIDDSYNGNFAGFISGLEVINRAAGRKIVLTPGIVELGEETKETHQKLAREYMRQIDLALLIDSVGTRYIRDYFDQHGFESYKYYSEATQAHDDLVNVLKSGDTILFSNDLSDSYR